MPFCDLELAARIERAERNLLADACANVRRRLPDVFTAEIGGGLAAITESGSPLNKVAGLGFAAFDEAAWPAIEVEHARRGMPVQVELSTLADPALGAFFTARGHRLVGVECVAGRMLADLAPPADKGIRIGTATIDRWIDTMVTGFATPDAQGIASHEAFDRSVIERVIRDFAAAAGVVLFVAHREGELAGAGAMRIDDGVAQLCGAATLPAHRRRGVQSVLLAHRLWHARQAGCDLAVVTTQPGSKSLQNAMRRGFALLYCRNVLVRDNLTG